MTLLPQGLKVHLAFGYTDMRKGIDGLAMLVGVASRFFTRSSTLHRVSGSFSWFSANSSRDSSEFTVLPPPRKTVISHEPSKGPLKRGSGFSFICKSVMSR